MEWSEGKPSPGGVPIDEKIVDEFVILRFAELLFGEKTHLQESLKNILEINDNFGAEGLKKFKHEFIELVEKYGKDV